MSSNSKSLVCSRINVIESKNKQMSPTNWAVKIVSMTSSQYKSTNLTGRGYKDNKEDMLHDSSFMSTSYAYNTNQYEVEEKYRQMKVYWAFKDWYARPSLSPIV